LCGLTIFRGNALGQIYVGDAFVLRVLRKILFNRRKLVSDGPTFISRRAIPKAENAGFYGSLVPSVFLATGPDGALYIADFYRRWVEHPQWVADTTAREKINWREGSAHGRIWRVHKRDVKASTMIQKLLEKASPAELVSEFKQIPNGWRR